MMNLKKVFLFVLLVTVVAVGTVFAQSLAMEARNRGYDDGFSGRPQRSPSYSNPDLIMEYNSGYSEGMMARRNSNSNTVQNSQGLNNPLSSQGNNWSVEPRFEIDTWREFGHDDRMIENTDIRGSLEFKLKF